MLIRSLHLKRLLSFGSDSERIELGSLNVLIGPNAAGKSNLIEAIGLLRATPGDFLAPIREGGGVGAWPWKGEPNAVAEIEAVISYKPEAHWNLRHRLAFRETAQRLELVDERIEDEVASPGREEPYVYFGYENGRPTFSVRPPDGGSSAAGQRDAPRRVLRREDIDPEQSILSQRKDPDQYPEISHLSAAYSRIGLFREWTFGRRSPPRSPAPADLRTAPLSEDTQNLGLVLNRFRRDVATKKALIDGLQQVFDGIRDFSVQIEGGTVQIFLEEERWTIPATRLSDGTVRWLSLLAMLLDPAPPPLLCIEEPELGLHPDLMPSLARLLTRASERTQLVVTTHSEVLVDAFSTSPEVVLVCERHDGATRMRRLEEKALAEWLKTYSLGELWSKGELGGSRW